MYTIIGVGIVIGIFTLCRFSLEVVFLKWSLGSWSRSFSSMFFDVCERFKTVFILERVSIPCNYGDGMRSPWQHYKVIEAKGKFGVSWCDLWPALVVVKGYREVMGYDSSPSKDTQLPSSIAKQWHTDKPPLWSPYRWPRGELHGSGRCETCQFTSYHFVWPIISSYSEVRDCTWADQAASTGKMPCPDPKPKYRPLNCDDDKKKFPVSASISCSLLLNCTHSHLFSHLCKFLIANQPPTYLNPSSHTQLCLMSYLAECACSCATTLIFTS